MYANIGVLIETCAVQPKLVQYCEILRRGGADIGTKVVNATHFVWKNYPRKLTSRPLHSRNLCEHCMQKKGL